ncbi:MAG: ThuA domain-containing protein [Bacteroidales bacterium]|nr:ThuA domain-containing protein [Bacteroidales bacterium]
MKQVLIILLVFISIGSQAQNDSYTGKQVLIYTRNGEGYVHDNIDASVEALVEICETMSVSAIISDDPDVFESKKLKKFDAVIFTNTNNEAFVNEKQREIFQEYIRSGKGFVGIHSACGSERDWPWFWSMLGGKFVRHPKFQEFDIKVIDPGHLSTKDLELTWKWEDECYYIDHLNPAINVLLAADLTTITDDKRNVYPGTVFGDLFPLAWYHEFEGGKVWYSALGHKIEHYKDIDFRNHLKGGIQWVLD